MTCRLNRTGGGNLAIAASLEPNAPMIIPGRAEIVFSLRDLSAEVMNRMKDGLRRVVQKSNRRERCLSVLEEVGRPKAAICDPGIVRAFSDAAESLCPGA
jgi:N-carbamoyl-L-amino-acid hydrolase